MDLLKTEEQYEIILEKVYNDRINLLDQHHFNLENDIDLDNVEHIINNYFNTKV